jgi:DMSO/TMAO reductase YedYZ molybdopterin-dependent catalytic subunit
VTDLHGSPAPPAGAGTDHAAGAGTDHGGAGAAADEAAMAADGTAMATDDAAMATDDACARGAAPPRRDGPAWALAGLAAGAVGLGVAQLTAAPAGPAYAPLVATGSAFVDRTPPWLKNAAVSTFGTHDKQVLIAGAGLVLAMLSGLAGMLARRRLRQAQWLVLALGLLAGLAAATRPDAPAASALPSLLGAVAGAVTLTRLARHGSGPAGTPAGAGPGRRGFLALTGTAAAGGAVAWLAGWAAGRSLHGAEASRDAVRLPAPTSPQPLLPPDAEVGVAGVAPFRVPNADFYRIDTALVAPRVDSGTWRLRVHGMVDRGVTLDFAELLRAGLVERDVTLTCVSNEVGGDLIGNARWLGLPLAPLLRRAGPRPDADMVLSTSADGWTASTPLAVLLDGRDALLAIGMNGVPLPIEHGFPVRMVVPGLYGYVSATKWVVDLEVTRFDRAAAYWTTRGWSDHGPVKTQSRIDVPKNGAQVSAGRVALAGVAWAQHRGISRVEVRVDDGPWQVARLAEVPSADTWRQWVLAWDAVAGRHRIRVRATDGTGAVQTGDQAPPEPDGATGWHTITVDVA